MQDARSWKNLGLSVAITGLLFPGAAAVAQDRGTLEAFDVRPKAPKQSFEAGRPIALRVEREILGRGEVVRARLFRGTRESLKKQPHDIRNTCWVYFSSQPRSVSIGAATKGPKTVNIVGSSRNWLGMDVNRRFAAEKWLIVFEVPSDHDASEVWLRPDAVATYFDSGIEVEVTPGSGDDAFTEQEVEQVFKDNDAAFKTVAMSVDPKGCLAVRRASSSSTVVKVSEECCEAVVEDRGQSDRRATK